MERKKLLQKMKSLFLIAIVLLIGQSVWGTQIVSYQLTNGYSGTPSGTFSTTATPTTTPWANNKLNTTGWNTSGHYYSISAISTLGYHTVVVNAKMSSATGGPTGFVLEYNIGSGWTSTGITGASGETGAISITATHLNYARTLPVECSNKASVHSSLRYFPSFLYL